MNKHSAEPMTGSVIRESDRAESDGNTPAHYPLLARCESCHREIRIEAALGKGWKHTAAPRPPRPRADDIAALTEVADLYAGMVRRLEERAASRGLDSSDTPAAELPVRTPQVSGHAPNHE
jgi:hypothetical protein